MKYFAGKCWFTDESVTEVILITATTIIGLIAVLTVIAWILK